MLLLLVFSLLLCSANICSCHLFQFLSFDVLFYDCKYPACVPSFFFSLSLACLLSFCTYILILPTVRFFRFCLEKLKDFRKALAIELSICRKQQHAHSSATAAASHQEKKNSNGNSVSTWHYSMCVISISFVSLQI